MTDLHLFDAFTPSFGSPASDASVEVSTNFDIGTDGTVTTLDWYRQATGGTPVPDRLRLYDANSGQVIAEITSGIADNGSVGWQRTTLTTPVQVYRGRTYKIAGNWTGTSHYCSWGADIHGGGNFPITVAATERSYHYGGTVVSGATSDNGAVFNFDVTFVPGSIAPPGSVSNTDLDAELSQWFSGASGTNEHHSDLPWDTHEKVTTVESAATGASGFDAIKAVADAIASVVSGLPGTIASAVTTITGQLTTMTGNISQTGIATVGSIAHDLLAFYNHNLDVLAGHATTGSSTTNFVWTAGTAVDVDGAKFLAVPADAYLLTIMTPPTGLPLNSADGVHIYYRAGWWCECIDGVGSERHYVDFEQTWLRDGTRRLGGCLVVLGPGGFGQLTPYTLEPA